MSLKMMADKFREDKTHICKQMIDTGYGIKMFHFHNHDTQSRSWLVMQRPRKIEKSRSLPNLYAFTSLRSTSSQPRMVPLHPCSIHSVAWGRQTLSPSLWSSELVLLYAENGLLDSLFLWLTVCPRIIPMTKDLLLARSVLISDVSFFPPLSSHDGSPSLQDCQVTLH